jgi:hypothetical protein
MIRKFLKALCLFTFFILSNTFAQYSPHYFLSKIPPPPNSICNANEKEILLWNDKLSFIINEMSTIQEDEKQKKEQAMAACKERMDMFEPANATKIEKLGQEISSTENNIEKILTEIITNYSEENGKIEVKYLTLLDPLFNQKKEAMANQRRTEAIDHKIATLQDARCIEQYEAKKHFLDQYKYQLNELVSLGSKGNNLDDELTGIIYLNYSFKTQYGFWLDLLINYAKELQIIYDHLSTDSNGSFNK